MSPKTATPEPAEIVADSADRLLLWTIENELTVHGATDRQRLLGGRLRRYLVGSCAHTWESLVTAGQAWPTHRQCSRCHDLDLLGEEAS